METCKFTVIILLLFKGSVLTDAEGNQISQEEFLKSRNVRTVEAFCMQPHDTTSLFGQAPLPDVLLSTYQALCDAHDSLNPNHTFLSDDQVINPEIDLGTCKFFVRVYAYQNMHTVMYVYEKCGGESRAWSVGLTIPAGVEANETAPGNDFTICKI